MRFIKKDDKEDMETLETELRDYITDCCIKYKSEMDEDVIIRLSEWCNVSLYKTKRLAKKIKIELESLNKSET